MTDLAGVRQFADYLRLVAAHAASEHAAGVPYWQAAASLELPGPYADWGFRERVVITMAAAYAGLGDPPAELPEILTPVAGREAGTTR